MKNQQDYIQDIAEIRSMMERSSKFVSLSGWAGILAGVYALAAVWMAHSVFGFTPNQIAYDTPNLEPVILLGFGTLVISLISAIFFSWKKADGNKESIWNVTSRRMLSSMAVPLFTGGLLIIALLPFGLTGLIAPLTLIFYGLALYNAGFYTIREVRLMGFIQLLLGLLNLGLIESGLLFWAIGFGGVHILYGIYMHFRYER